MRQVFCQVSSWFKAARERLVNKRKKVSLIQNEKGITLIELLCVLVIIGIIAAIAIPSLTSVLKRSQANADIATAENFHRIVQLEMMLCNNGAALESGSIATLTVCGTKAVDLLATTPKLNLYPTETLYLSVDEADASKFSIHVTSGGTMGDSLYPTADGAYLDYSWQ